MNKIKKNNSFNKILEVIRSLPLWVLQSLYVEIDGLLEDKGNKTHLKELDRTDLLQLFIPTPTMLGEKITDPLYQNSYLGKFDEKCVKLLKLAVEENNLIDICLCNQWTLKECCKVLLKCLDNHYIENTISSNMLTTMLFISGKIMTGEFLIRKNLLTKNQLEWALQIQGDMNNTFDNKNKIIDVLINLNYIKKDVIDDYLSLKELAQGTFDIPDNTKPYIKRIDELENIEKTLKEEINTKDHAIKKLIKENRLMENKIQELRDNFENTSKKSTEITRQLNDYERKFGMFKKL